MPHFEILSHPTKHLGSGIQLVHNDAYNMISKNNILAQITCILITKYGALIITLI